MTTRTAPTIEQLRRARELAASRVRTPEAPRPQNALNRARRTLLQVEREQEFLRPDTYTAHEFRTELGTLVDYAAICLECGQPFQHLSHQRAPEPLPRPGATTSIQDLVDQWTTEAVVSPDDSLEASRHALHGDADHRSDDRRPTSTPSQVIAPRYVDTLVPLAAAVYQRVRVLLEPGETERELDLMRPRPQPRTRPEKCARCGYRGLLPRMQTCSQCGHDRNQRVKPIKSRVAERIGGYEFTPFAK